MTEKIRLQFSPYTYARVAVMRSRLLTRDDYARLLKMGYNETIKFLEESGYKREMSEYDIASKDLTIIEAALSANLIREFMKLYRISNPSMREVISTYLLRYDLANLKMIIRSKFAGVSEKELEQLFYDSVYYSKEFFVNLSKKERVLDIINTFSSLRFKRLRTDNLFDLENDLDQHHLQRVHAFAQNLRGEGKVVAEFFKQELEIENIRLLLRLKREKRTDHQQYFINPSPFVLQLAEKKTVEDVLEALRRKKLITFSEKEAHPFAKFEIDLETALLHKTFLLMHKHLLSANYILGYFLAKEMEVRNLKILVKSKKFNLPNDFTESMLVMAA